MSTIEEIHTGLEQLEVNYHFKIPKFASVYIIIYCKVNPNNYIL